MKHSAYFSLQMPGWTVCHRSSQFVPVPNLCAVYRDDAATNARLFSPGRHELQLGILSNFVKCEGGSYCFFDPLVPTSSGTAASVSAHHHEVSSYELATLNFLLIINNIVGILHTRCLHNQGNQRTRGKMK